LVSIESAYAWIGLCMVLRPHQHSIGYMGLMGDGFYRSEDPTNSIKVLKEKSYKGKTRSQAAARIGDRTASQ